MEIGEPTDSRFFDGLVRVIAKDGSVWWTFPQYAEAHANLESWCAGTQHDRERIKDYEHKYWRTKR